MKQNTPSWKGSIELRSREILAQYKCFIFLPKICPLETLKDRFLFFVGAKILLYNCVVELVLFQRK